MNHAKAPAPTSFVVNLMSDRNETWQGTVTLIGQKATRATKVPLPIRRGAGGASDTVAASKETVPFRSLLELIHLLDSAFEKGEKAI